MTKRQLEYEDKQCKQIYLWSLKIVKLSLLVIFGVYLTNWVIGLL